MVDCASARRKSASRCPTSCRDKASISFACFLTFPAINLSAASASDGYFKHNPCTSALFYKENIRFYFGNCRRRVGPIIEYGNVSQDSARSIEMHYLFTAILILLKGADLASDNHKEASCRFP